MLPHLPPALYRHLASPEFGMSNVSEYHQSPVARGHALKEQQAMASAPGTFQVVLPSRRGGSTSSFSKVRPGCLITQDFMARSSGDLRRVVWPIKLPGPGSQLSTWQFPLLKYEDGDNREGASLGAVANFMLGKCLTAISSASRCQSHGLVHCVLGEIVSLPFQATRYISHAKVVSRS